MNKDGGVHIHRDKEKDKDNIKGEERDADADRDRDRRDAIDGPRAPASPPDPVTVSRTGTSSAMAPPATPVEARPGMSSTMWALAQGEAHVLHQQMTETAQKRVSTLDYLRKA